MNKESSFPLTAMETTPTWLLNWKLAAVQQEQPQL